MKELTHAQSILMALGGLLMVIGTGCVVFDVMRDITTVIFAVGAVLFAAMQMQQLYLGNSITVKRLRRTMIMGDICFILAAVLMLENHFKVVFQYVATTMEGYNNWVHIVHNNWVILLLIGALIEIYTSHRISYELKKEENPS